MKVTSERIRQIQQLADNNIDELQEICRELLLVRKHLLIVLTTKRLGEILERNGF